MILNSIILKQLQVLDNVPDKAALMMRSIIDKALAKATHLILVALKTCLDALGVALAVGINKILDKEVRHSTAVTAVKINMPT